MTMTLEQIDGMNLQVGDKIEIKLNNGDEREGHTTICYFVRISQGMYLEYSHVSNGTNKRSSFWLQESILTEIDDIKRLDYRKE